ncbi:serine hydrolase [Kitasatospora sp. NPDC050543]|uniref:serine hydrolase n=1 Tax=Kitasatospora sp. NPDC050543 TaxID=3364054 RepID=UPI0037B23F5C
MTLTLSSFRPTSGHTSTADQASRGPSRRSSGSALRRLAARTAIVALAGAGVLAVVVPPAGAVPARPAAEQAVAVAGSSVTDGAALEAAVRAVVEQGGASAALAEVRAGGHSAWKGAAGTADLDTGEPASADGRFRIGSITKTFVATVVLQLVAEHRLALDDPIERHLPGVVPNGGAITVRQLLNHTSGIFNYTEDPAFDRSGDKLHEWLTVGRWRTHHPEQLVALATGHEPYFAPGQGWHYSNTNYVIVGMLIQRTTGRSWAEEVERRIIRPLGLRNTSMPLSSVSVPGPHAHAYFKLPEGGRADVTMINPSMFGAAGAGISSTADLTRFNAALLGGRLLGPAELAEMKRTVDLGGGAGYGLGLSRTVLPCGEFWGHSGSVPGYGTMLLGNAAGTRQFAGSANPYDTSDPRATDTAVNQLVVTAVCGPASTPQPAAKAPTAPAVQLP